MEDSGIDSEDRLSAPFEETSKGCNVSKPVDSPMEDLDVVFRDRAACEEIRKSNSRYSNGEEEVEERRPQPPNTCRILQRKLELKVERAKRNYSQYQEDCVRNSQTANLIPISRLSIPGNSEKKPLVDYNSDSSEEQEDVSFFSSKLKSEKKHKKAELSDTFSIQEMTIESEHESDDSGSQNLELLPPLAKSTLLEKFLSCFNCHKLRS